MCPFLNRVFLISRGFGGDEPRQKKLCNWKSLIFGESSMLGAGIFTINPPQKRPSFVGKYSSTMVRIWVYLESGDVPAMELTGFLAVLSQKYHQSQDDEHRTKIFYKFL